MNLSDVLAAPWAILPSKLEEIHAVASAHARGERPDLAGIEARLGRPLDNQPSPLRVVDGVAVVALDGVLAKRMNLMTQISGGTSTQLAAQTLRRAIDDPAVQAIVLAIDSPGGSVDGTEALASVVREGAQRKRILTLADGCMASSAYWIGAAAGPGNVYLAEKTTLMGSIGVVAKHVDVSGAETQSGVKTTEITAGRFKRVASPYAPLTDAGRQTLQDQVDYIYSLFVESVARDRGVSTDRVLNRMAEGRIFTGQQAIDAGLADGFSTMENLIRTARLNPSPNALLSAGGASISKEPSMTNTTGFSDAELRRHYNSQPDLKDRYGSFDAYIASMSALSQTSRNVATADTDWSRVDREAKDLAAREGLDYFAAVKRVMAEGKAVHR